MKKLISIGVALALLTMVVVPVGVAAQDEITEPGTYSKTPFGILGSGIQLVGSIVQDLSGVIDPYIEDFGMTSTDIAGITETVGHWSGVDLAWMTDMTAWSMVLVGDVVKTADPLIAGVAELPIDLSDVADIFYVAGARLWDPWGTYAGNATLPDVVIDAFPPTLPLP